MMRIAIVTARKNCKVRFILGLGVIALVPHPSKAARLNASLEHPTYSFSRMLNGPAQY